ncbi:MAG: ATP-binding protein [Bacteroidetes bacterium]|nr:ATP-binding protein [Bacteroidota bacterium]
MLYKIAVTGPESTGKTELVKQLAELYDTVYVPEYAREYLDKNGMQYTREDVLKMAKGQIELEREQSIKANRILFSDTDMIAYKIWLDFYTWEVPLWLTDHITKNRFDLYLLTDIDIPWVADGQRANPGDREMLFNRFQEELERLDADFGVISGKGMLRLDNAISTIEEHMKL